MRKILPYFIIVFVITSGFVTIPAKDIFTKEHHKAQAIEYQLNIPLSFPEFQSDWIQTLPQGQKIIIDGFDHLNNPGCPSLPVKNIVLGLPPCTTFISVGIQMGEKIQLPGSYDVLPSSAPYPYIKGTIPDNCQGRNTEVYTSDDAFPSEAYSLRTKGTLGYYPYVALSICPFVYSPLSGTLMYMSTVELTVHYTYDSHPLQQDYSKNTRVDTLAASLFMNYDSIKPYYIRQETLPSTAAETVDYMIVTSEDLLDAITQSNFIMWKNALGYTTTIVCTSDQTIVDQPGWDLAEKIRNYLRESYLNIGLRYVLLVGDYLTVPMRYCYPNPLNHQNTAGTPGGTGGEVPTDYYYADLSNPDDVSWDADGDSYYGEYLQDHPDFLPEIFVGRIPVNDPSKVTYTLNKIVSFEQDTGEWKHHALAPGAFFYFSNETAPHTGPMDGARISAVIADEFMTGWTVSRYTEQEGLETSIFPGEPLTEAAWTKDWKDNQYAIVNWAAHGWSNLIARKIWSSDDGDNLPEPNEMTWPTLVSTSSDLDDDYPSIVTAISCYVGYPEPNSWGNLAIDLLTLPGYGASVGVISSARTPYGNLDWPDDLGGSDSIIYELNNNLINRSLCLGEAFYHAKFFCNLHYAWSSYEEYLDLYTFNLYGDPSLMYEGIEANVPHITITKPVPALYLCNLRILPCRSPFIIGAIDVEVNASDEDSGIAYVQFRIDGELLGNITSSPFIWRWEQRAFGKHTLTVRAYNATGSFASDELSVRKFF